MSKTYFISGIDTDAGKSYCTGWWAKQMAVLGQKVITQKFIQTGNLEFSEDIDLHRRLMGIDMLPEDIDHTTAPVIFSYPCSPHLAARIDGKEINLSIIGAGGLMVPISDDCFTIDYVVTRKLPLVLVVHGGLGSINHTILSLEAIKQRDIQLPYILYNRHFDTDKEIAAETRAFLSRYLSLHFPDTRIIDVPNIPIEQFN